jgi:ketosteroid isomerase-like protein
MHPNAQLLERLYTSFHNRDAETMVASYHPDAVFSDPVFTELRGKQVGAMWRMLATRAKDLKIEFRDIHADDETGRAHWEAYYTFSETGRRVHNVVDATFRFQGGKIVRHDDRFDLWRWSAMALGLKGRLLGWLPPVQNAIRAKAARGLDQFSATS